MKFFRNIRIVSALAFSAIALSTTVDAFNFGGMLKSAGHTFNHSFGSFKKSPFGNIAMGLGKSYVQQRASKKLGPMGGGYCR